MVIAFLLITLGGLFYLCFRPPTILLFSWLDFVGFDYSQFQNINIKVPLLFLNHFPSVLFVLFGSIVISILWNDNGHYYIVYTSIFVLMNIIYEIITRDIGDSIAVIAVYIIIVVVYTRSLGVKYEK